MIEHHLQYINGPKKGKTIKLNPVRTLLGSAKHCDIILLDPLVMGEHIKITIENSNVKLEKIEKKASLKVDGKPVEECFVKEDQNIQISVLSFKLKIKNTLTKIVPLENNDNVILKKQKPVLSEKKEVNDKIIDSRNNSSLFQIIKIGLLVCLMFSALYLYQSIKPAEKPPVILPYKAGEEKLIDLRGYLKRENVKARPVTVKVYHSEIVRAKIEKISLTVLWFKTLTEGESIVELFDNKGNSLIKFNFIVKGQKKSRSKLFEEEMTSPSKRTSQATESMKKAFMVEAETPHEALAYYQKALDLLTSVSTSSELYFECRKKMKASEKVMEQRLKELWKQSNNYRKNKSYEEALPYIEKILSLIPDTDDIEHQRALIYKKYILLKI